MRTQHHRHSALRGMIVATLAATVLGMPAAALAQTAKEIEIEKRVAELEKMVQQLVAD